MAVGHVHRNVSNGDPPPVHPSAARVQDCPTGSERGGLRFDSRVRNVEYRLGAPPRKTLRVAQVVSSSHNRLLVDQAAPSANLSTHVAGVDSTAVLGHATTQVVDRAAPAIYDDLHNCAGWPPSDSSSSTASDTSTCKTWRSNVHERNEHSYLSEARLLASKPS